MCLLTTNRKSLLLQLLLLPSTMTLLIRYRYLCCDITSVAMLPLPPLIRYCQHCCDATTIATATAADSLLPPLLRWNRYHYCCRRRCWFATAAADSLLPLLIRYWHCCWFATAAADSLLTLLLIRYCRCWLRCYRYWPLLSPLLICYRLLYCDATTSAPLLLTRCRRCRCLRWWDAAVAASAPLMRC